MRIKSCILILSLLLISRITQADQLFYGIALINQQLSQDIKYVPSGTTASIEDTGTGLGLYADYFYQGTYRFNSTLSYIDYASFSLSSLTFSADYLIPLDSNFTFFTGATAGIAAMQFSGTSISDISLGSLYGIQAGAIAFLPHGIMLELGYRLRPANIETDILDATGTLTATSTVDQLNETYINLVISF